MPGQTVCICATAIERTDKVVRTLRRAEQEADAWAANGEPTQVSVGQAHVPRLGSAPTETRRLHHACARCTLTGISSATLRISGALSSFGVAQAAEQNFRGDAGLDEIQFLPRVRGMFARVSSLEVECGGAAWTYSQLHTSHRERPRPPVVTEALELLLALLLSQFLLTPLCFPRFT